MSESRETVAKRSGEIRQEGEKVIWASFACPEKAIFSAISRTGSSWDLVYANGASAGHLYTEVDGFVVYVPNGGSGFVEAWHLRAIADILDYLNAPWEEQISKDMKPKEPWYEAEDCEACAESCAEEGIEYTNEMVWDNDHGCWICQSCGQPQ